MQWIAQGAKIGIAEGKGVEIPDDVDEVKLTYSSVNLYNLSAGLEK